MRKDIQFKTEDGVTLRGWHYIPDGAKGRLPTVVMAHGFSGVKELFLDKYAEVFCKAGLAAVVYDHRNFGASDGKPRQHINPWEQVAGFRDAITYAETLPETDRERIGIWGSSYAGAHVIVVGATDKRVKCVVSQVPLMSGAENVKRLVRPDLLVGMRKMFDEDRRARAQGKPPMMIPVVGREGEPSALPTPDTYDFLMGEGKAAAPNWINECTLHSVEMFTEYEPGAYIQHVSPTPLMIIMGLRDGLTVGDITLQAYERALQPKKLVALKGGHFDAYTDGFAIGSAAARDWFLEHLK